MSEPTYFRTLCASAICSFWKISGGKKGESFPPSSEKTLRCLGRGAGPPLRSCAAGFAWAFPGEGRTGQLASPSPHPQIPAWAPGGDPAPQNATAGSPSAAAMDLTLSRHCSASFSIFGVSGVTPSPPSVGTGRVLGSRRGGHQARRPHGPAESTAAGDGGAGMGGLGGGGSCPTCPCRILLQGLGDEGDALQVLHVGLLPDRWWGGRKR